MPQPSMNCVALDVVPVTGGRDLSNHYAHRYFDALDRGSNGS